MSGGAFIKASLLVAFVAGCALVAGVWQHREPRTLGLEELAAFAAEDDPKLGSAWPAVLRSAARPGDALLVYLPECTGCTVDGLPRPLPAALRSAILVKRTEADAPPVPAGGAFVVDRDGSVQRMLNAYGGPRVFRYSAGRLRDLQTPNETWRAFIARSGR